MFCSTDEFDKRWERFGLDNEDRRKLENAIIANPKIGAVIRGTGGLRKMRFAFGGKGKSGSSRILYVDISMSERVYLIGIYAKSEQEALTEEQKQRLKVVVEKIKGESGG
jgi:mRNA-degrading endonuclease RelE of RelBE toxin-antitoxin system